MQPRFNQCDNTTLSKMLLGGWEDTTNENQTNSSIDRYIQYMAFNTFSCILDHNSVSLNWFLLYLTLLLSQIEKAPNSLDWQMNAWMSLIGPRHKRSNLILILRSTSSPINKVFVFTFFGIFSLPPTSKNVCYLRPV